MCLGSILLAPNVQTHAAKSAQFGPIELGDYAALRVDRRADRFKMSGVPTARHATEMI